MNGRRRLGITGGSFIEATHLIACHPKSAYANRVFEKSAALRTIFAELQILVGSYV